MALDIKHGDLVRSLAHDGVVWIVVNTSRSDEMSGVYVGKPKDGFMPGIVAEPGPPEWDDETVWEKIGNAEHIVIKFAEVLVKELEKIDAT